MSFTFHHYADQPDSGYSSSSAANKGKSTGLLGSLKEFFGRKSEKSRKGILPQTKSNSDVSDNYGNNKSGGNNLSGASPYSGGLSPNAFFSDQGVKRTSDIFKPKPFRETSIAAPLLHVQQEKIQNRAPPKEEIEIPVAAGPARKSIVGLFDEPAPVKSAVTTTSESTIPEQPMAEVKTDSSTPHGISSHQSSTSSRSTTVSSITVPMIKVTTHSSDDEKQEEKQAKKHEIHIEVHLEKHEEVSIEVCEEHGEKHEDKHNEKHGEGENNEEKHEETLNTGVNEFNEIDVEPLNLKTLTTHDSGNLSIHSEDPRRINTESQEKKSRATNRRGSLPNSFVSDISAGSSKSERSEGRKNRRRSGPKLIGPQAKQREDELYYAPYGLMEHHMLPAIPPPIPMGDPRYMPHPYMMPHPSMVHPNASKHGGQKPHRPETAPSKAGRYAQMPYSPPNMAPPKPGRYGQVPHPPDMVPPIVGRYNDEIPDTEQPKSNGRRKHMQPHPQQLPIPHDPRYLQPHPHAYQQMYGGYGGMMPPPQIMFPPVKEESVEGSGFNEPRGAKPMKRTNKAKRSKTMDPTRSRPKVESRRKGTSEIDENEESPKGLDDFALY